jgi:hypothetical protein
MDEWSSMVTPNSDERWEMDHRQVRRLGRRGITVLTLVLLILAVVVGAVLLYRYR